MKGKTSDSSETQILNVVVGQRWDEIQMECLSTGFESSMMARTFIPEGEI